VRALKDQNYSNTKETKMKVDLPHVEHAVKVLVKSPEGECVKILDSSHRSFEIDLPDSVHEDEVEVVACSLDECGKAVGNVAVLKEAVEVEPKVEDEEDEPEHKEKDDEDAPVEADEEAAKSPPTEKAPEPVQKELKPRKLPKPRKMSDAE
jgi:hypothetical protein